MDNISFDFPEVSNNENISLLDELSADDTKNMNFDQYRNKVYSNLSILENDIIKQLILHDKELLSMFQNFNESEEILNSLEASLTTFKEKLSIINTEMKSLQSKSNEISTKLKNRKAFEEELFKLLDSLILAPDFLNDITTKEVDEEFIDKISKLDTKLQIFQNGELPESNAVDEISKSYLLIFST